MTGLVQERNDRNQEKYKVSQSRGKSRIGLVQEQNYRDRNSQFPLAFFSALVVV